MATAEGVLVVRTFCFNNKAKKSGPHHELQEKAFFRAPCHKKTAHMATNTAERAFFRAHIATQMQLTQPQQKSSSAKGQLTLNCALRTFLWSLHCKAKTLNIATVEGILESLHCKQKQFTQPPQLRKERRRRLTWLQQKAFHQSQCHHNQRRTACSGLQQKALLRAKTACCGSHS